MGFSKSIQFAGSSIGPRRETKFWPRPLARTRPREIVVRCEGLGLDGKQRRVGLDKGADGRGMVEQALHLAAIERDREAAEAVEGECALFGDFHSDRIGSIGEGELRLERVDLGLGLCEVLKDGHVISSYLHRCIIATIASSHIDRLASNHELLQRSGAGYVCSAISLASIHQPADLRLTCTNHILPELPSILPRCIPDNSMAKTMASGPGTLTLRVGQALFLLASQYISTFRPRQREGQRGGISLPDAIVSAIGPSGGY